MLWAGSLAFKTSAGVVRMVCPVKDIPNDDYVHQVQERSPSPRPQSRAVRGVLRWQARPWPEPAGAPHRFPYRFWTGFSSTLRAFWPPIHPSRLTIRAPHSAVAISCRLSTSGRSIAINHQLSAINYPDRCSYRFWTGFSSDLRAFWPRIHPSPLTIRAPHSAVAISCRLSTRLSTTGPSAAINHQLSAINYPDRFHTDLLLHHCVNLSLPASSSVCVAWWWSGGGVGVAATTAGRLLGLGGRRGRGVGARLPLIAAAGQQRR